MAPRDVVVLGSTGSVGRQCAAVVREHPGEFAIAGLGGRRWQCGGLGRADRGVPAADRRGEPRRGGGRSARGC
ncbi:hypothetical protein ACIQF6_31045 [Kitasatospora sp. NPDC092948]|uniref:hypothetical protein n=1 Tax=Kitasatospora sp. NPDC092948 TaxID=3364088 RepID=UPI0038229EAE